MSEIVSHVSDDEWDSWETARTERAEEDRLLSRIKRAGGGNDSSATTTTTSTRWAPVPLAPHVDGDHEPEKTEFLARIDGEGLLYGGRLHSIYGEPESGKGWLMLAAAAQIFAKFVNGLVLYIDFEDGPASIVGRLLALGVKPDDIKNRFVYVRPESPIGSPEQLDDLLYGNGDDTFLVVLDGVTEGMVLHGLDPVINTDVAKWRELVVNPFVDPLGFAPVVEIDHVVKSKEDRGRYALGGGHKLAGVDVAYGVKVLEPFGRGRNGKLKLTVQKDRPGYVRGFAPDDVAAIVDIESADDKVSVTLRSSDSAQDKDAGTFRPTFLMERVSRALEEHDGLSKRALRDTVKGRARWVDDALELLIIEGHIRVERDGQAVRHHLDKPYREDDDTNRVPVSQPCPDRVPDTVGSTVSPCPTPTGGHGPGHDATANGTDPTVSRLEDRAERFERDYPEAAA